MTILKLQMLHSQSSTIYIDKICLVLNTFRNQQNMSTLLNICSGEGITDKGLYKDNYATPVMYM